MKLIYKTKIVGFIFLFFAATLSHGQTPQNGGENKTKGKIDKAKVPKAVTKAYETEYPKTTNESWYGYPSFSNESDWYGYDPEVMTDINPEYYIVRFLKETFPHKVMYSKTGQKIAEHKGVDFDLPKAILNSLSKGQLSDWVVVKEKEEIVRHPDKMKVYKIELKKDNAKRIVFYLPDGTLLHEIKGKP
ncbi:MAG TPA: hypothetical protein VK766_08945 [Cytophagaceae bacterium]|jgi:hypothetical protein|nr:hypothetical protein [Cytophagaceae bacterium]